MWNYKFLKVSYKFLKTLPDKFIYIGIKFLKFFEVLFWEVKNYAKYRARENL